VGITCNFNQSDFEDEVNRQKEELYSKILNAFIYAGEDFIKNSREQGQDHAAGQYKDITGNLRNSIGYFIFQDGRIVSDQGKMQSPKELSILNEMIHSVADIIKPTGFQLIGFAGMNYASYVESKGYNVISYQADICLVDLAGYLEDLNQIEKGTAASIEDTFLPDDLPANFYIKD
jgi:hypothetical protein